MNRSIAIVGGTGAEGMGLGLRWARAGESVVIGSRDVQKAKDTAQRIAMKVGSACQIQGAENSEAVSACGVVVLTVPFGGHATILNKLRSSFKADTVLIDTTVPLAASVGGLPTRTLGVWQGSAAQQAAELVPSHVRVTAAFHNVSAGLLSEDGPVDSDVIVCGNDESAVEITSELAENPRRKSYQGGEA